MMNHQLIQQPVSFPAQQPVQTIMREDDEVNLSSYLNILFDNRRLIGIIALAVMLLGAAYAFIAKPVYEANMLVHVEENTPHETKNILGEMASLFEVKAATTSEMELLRSRLVVSRAIDNLRLYISAQPKYFPWFGAWLAERNKQLSNPGLFGFGGYTWGAEKIDVSIFNVPDALQNREFAVTAEKDGQFRVSDKESKLDFQGSVGITQIVETDKGPIELRVEQLAAKPGAQFSLRRSSRLTAIEGVQKDMIIAEQGKQSGVVSVTLQGTDPKIVNNILTEVGREYVRQNGARKTEEAEKSLAYLNKQLPELKQQLEQAESKYNQFRNTHGTIDLGEEAKLSLQQSAAAKLRRIELQQKKTELLNRFTSNHPAVEGVDSQLKEINGEIQTVAQHIKTLPLLEQDALRLNRDVKVNTDLYTALLNTAQQLRMITLGKVSNVRLVDAPMMPEKPISPNRPRIIALAVLIGLMLGVAVAFIKKSLYGSLDDQHEIEKISGLPVYAAIPHSKKQKELFEQISSKFQKVPLLAKVSSADVAIESLRNFRTALQFSMPTAKNNIVLITGPTAGIGKTFVSANLAAIMAATGQRVLLIDADFRNGRLHQYFDLSRQGGLADAISGARRVEQVIHRGVVENMDFISTGSLPPSPAELLMRPGFGALLKTLSANYDLILIDAAPVLAVADTLIIGAHAGAIYLMTRAGVTTAGEMIESMKRLKQTGLSTKGILFNDLKQRVGQYNYGYKYGRYQSVQYAAEPTHLIEAAPNLR